MFFSIQSFISEIPQYQRGPYCYMCEGTKPSDCFHVDVCNKGQVNTDCCFIYSILTNMFTFTFYFQTETYQGIALTKRYVCN